MTEQPEREVEEMQERSDRLEDDIKDVREDWERKKQDSSVPGAAGDPAQAEKGPQPETNYPSKGDESVSDDDDAADGGDNPVGGDLGSAGDDDAA